MARVRAVVACSPCEPPKMSAQEEKERFKKGYGFSKPLPARSPVDGWQHGHIIAGDSYFTPQKEVALVKGTPHKFKHRRSGSVYGGRTSKRKTR